MIRWITLLMLATVTFAGCLGDDPSAEDAAFEPASDDGPSEDLNAPPDTQDLTEPVQTVSLAWEQGTSLYASVADNLLCQPGPLVGLTHDSFEVDPATYGASFELELTGGTGASEYGLVFWMDCGTARESQDFSEGVDRLLTGTVPEGAQIAIVFADAGESFTAAYKA